MQLENYSQLTLLIAISLSHPNLKDLILENLKIVSTDGALAPSLYRAFS